MSMLALLMCAITSAAMQSVPAMTVQTISCSRIRSLYWLYRTTKKVFDIPVAATEACSYDRTVAVEVIDQRATPLREKHCTIESNTITIKAGERGLTTYASAVITMPSQLPTRWVSPCVCSRSKLTNGICMKKNYEAKVILQKMLSVRHQSFNGYAVLTSTYMQEFMPNVDNPPIKAIIDSERRKHHYLWKDFFLRWLSRVKIRFTTKTTSLNPAD